jgi:hypothetical protein
MIAPGVRVRACTVACVARDAAAGTTAKLLLKCGRAALTSQSSRERERKTARAGRLPPEPSHPSGWRMESVDEGWRSWFGVVVRARGFIERSVLHGLLIDRPSAGRSNQTFAPAGSDRNRTLRALYAPRRLSVHSAGAVTESTRAAVSIFQRRSAVMTSSDGDDACRQ